VIRTTTATGATVTPTAPSATTTTTNTSAPAVVETKKSGLSGGAIAGIAIGAAIALILGAAVVYMCGRQKTMGEILRNSQQPPAHNIYQPASPGLSEAQYPNMQKTPNTISDGFSGGAPYAHGAETESYRSASPPIDERTGMIQTTQHSIMSPGSFGPGPGQPSPSLSGLASPGSAGLVSPMYYQPHEADSTSRYVDVPP